MSDPADASLHQLHALHARIYPSAASYPSRARGEDVLRRLAEAHRLAPAAVIEQLVALILAEEAEIARRMLRNPELARQALAEAFGARTGKTAA